MADLQALVDSLAAEIGRPAGIDDRQLRAVAYSSHRDDVDPVRRASILQRTAPAEVAGWLRSLGLQDADAITRVPPNAQLAMAARVCAPLRFEGLLLGYLWLIDEPEPLSEDALAVVGRYAEALSIELYLARRLENEERERELRLVAQVCGARSGDARVAAAELGHSGMLAVAERYGALVVGAFAAASDGMPDAVRARLAAAAEQVRRRSAPRQLLIHPLGDQVIGIVAAESDEELERRARALAPPAAEHLADTDGWRALVAIGAPARSVVDLPRSFQQARAALRVGRAIGGPDPVVAWSSLGPHRVLTDLLGERDPGEVVVEGFVRLLRAPDAATLVTTLESYLERGDVRAAAAQLHLHRSSLYGRLRRIEEITGLDLHAGEDRLELHLGLLLWRLGGGGDPTAVDAGGDRTRPPTIAMPAKPS